MAESIRWPCAACGVGSQTTCNLIPGRPFAFLGSSSNACHRPPLPPRPDPNFRKLFYSFFKTLVGKEIAVELKNDVALTGTLHSVDQYLNVKLTDVHVVEAERYPQLVSTCRGDSSTVLNCSSRRRSPRLLSVATSTLTFDGNQTQANDATPLTGESQVLEVDGGDSRGRLLPLCHGPRNRFHCKPST